LTEVLSGRRTVASAAVVLAITARQVNRLLIRLRYDKHSTESALHHFSWSAPMSNYQTT
jgi:hypothetical protein